MGQGHWQDALEGGLASKGRGRANVKGDLHRDLAADRVRDQGQAAREP